MDKLTKLQGRVAELKLLMDEYRDTPQCGLKAYKRHGKYVMEHLIAVDEEYRMRVFGR